MSVIEQVERSISPMAKGKLKKNARVSSKGIGDLLLRESQQGVKRVITSDPMDIFPEEE